MKELTSLDGGSAKKKASKPAAKPALKTDSKRDLRPLYAFFITLLLYIVCMLFCNKYPFGKYSFLVSDLQAQYAPFLALLRSKIMDMRDVPKDNILSYLTYSFRLGLGRNFMSTFGYYLASPFNLIYLFIDESQIDATVLAIVTLKLSLSAGFMSLFLGKRIEDKKSLWPVLLGICYAFSLYSQAFMFQIMWLDGYMLLPLILFFTEKFVKDQKYLGLVISLLVLFTANYYIAYMTGIACFLYLCIRMFEQKVQIKKAVCIAVRYVLAAGFTGLITAVMLVPVGLDTIRNADQTVSNHGTDVLSYSPVTLIHLFLSGEPAKFSEVLIGNYPFLFIALPVTLMMLIYFLSPIFKGRERKVHAVCFVGAVLSTMLEPIDVAWQVFDDPNWFWHRHAFVFLPLFLVISLRVLMRMKEIARKDILKAMVTVIVLAVIDFSFGRMKGDSTSFLYNVILAIVYSAIFAGFSVEKWPDQLRDMNKMLSPFLAGIIGFELIYVGPMLSSSIETMTNFGGDAAEYSNSINAEIEFGNYAKELAASTGSFRAETESVPDYGLDYYVEEGQAFYGNYNGLSFFNSNSNKNMHRFVKQLGFQTNYNYFAVGHSYTCPSVDAFFSISAVSSRRELAFYRFDGTDSYGNGLKFYANENVLPLGFAADKGAMDFDYYRLESDVEQKDYYALQNEWYQSMFPQAFEQDFFHEIDTGITGEPVITNGAFFNGTDYTTYAALLRKNKQTEDAEDESDGSDESSDPLGLEGTVSDKLEENVTDIYRLNENIPIVVEYNFKAPSNDEIYCSLVTGRIVDGTEIYVNGILIKEFSSNAFYSQIIRIGSFEEGEDVKVTFMAAEDKWSFLNIRFATFDNEAFTSQFANIDRSKVTAVEVYDGYAKFDISNLDSNEMVLTTIPAESGWKLYIDGEPSEIKTYQNAFIAFDAGSGNHTAELVFKAPALNLGIYISCFGIVCLAAFIFVDKSISKKKAKE